MSKIKVLVGLVPSKGCEGLFQASTPAPGGLLVIFGIPWLAEASPPSLPSSSHGVLPVCLCKFPFFIRTSVLLD